MSPAFACKRRLESSTAFLLFKFSSVLFTDELLKVVFELYPVVAHLQSPDWVGGRKRRSKGRYIALNLIRSETTETGLAVSVIRPLLPPCTPLRGKLRAPRLIRNGGAVANHSSNPHWALGALSLFILNLSGSRKQVLDEM